MPQLIFFQTLVADELSEKGTYNILSDTQHRFPMQYWPIKWQ